MPTIRIPAPLRKLTGDTEVVEVSGATINEVLAALENRHPGIGERIHDENGKIRRFVNVFLNDEDIRFLDNTETPVKDTDEISIVPAIAGG